MTLPPTLLAARGSRLEYRTRFLAVPPAGILEQKRDCSQSIVKHKEYSMLPSIRPLQFEKALSLLTREKEF